MSRVLVVGDVIDDLVVQPRGRIAPGTDTPARITPTPGGSGANAAVWLARAGATVRFAGRVGADDVARHANLLAAAGVEPVLVADPDRPTGRIVVLVGADGERTMLTDRGANLGLRGADLPDTLLTDVACLHVSGYSLFTDPVRDAVCDLMARARAAGARVSLDPGSVGFLQEVGPARFRTWLGSVDLLLPNLAEAQLLAQVTGDHGTTGGATTGGATIGGAARAALEPVVAALLTDVALVAVTCGSAGAVVAGRDLDAVAVPAVPAHVVDTTGAGDAFTGGFVAAWSAGADPVAAARAGVAMAARAVGHPGGRPPSGKPAAP